MAECPSILSWAIKGYQSLQAVGRFDQPSDAIEAMQELEDLTSPITAFVRDVCKIEPCARAIVDDLYIAWLAWLQSQGWNHSTTKENFGQDLISAVPSVTKKRNHKTGAFYDGIKIRGE